MKSKSLQIKLLPIIIVVLFSFASSGCGLVNSLSESFSDIVGDSDTATVIANRAQIRSSYAVVAADLLEVRRGEKLEVLEETEFEKIRWFRVRAADEDKTEGWIEAQNVIIGSLLEKSQKLAADSKDLQPQATAQLRAAANLRLSPEQKTDNLLFKLEGDAKFEIIGWRYVPKTQEETSTDDAANVVKPKTKNAEVEAAKQEKSAENLDEKYDVWYLVRLAPQVSPAPAGWIFGRQIELQVPSEIVFYQSDANKFVAWQRLDSTDAGDRFNTARENDLTKIAKPSNYVVLTRSNGVKARNGEEPDFDGIIVYGFDPYNKEYYSAYRSPEVWGKIPLRIEGAGDNKTFVVSLSNAAGQMEEKRFTVVKDPKGGRLRVTAPPDISVKK